jgi:hypothetical protein
MTAENVKTLIAQYKDALDENTKEEQRLQANLDKYDVELAFKMGLVDLKAKEDIS